MPTAIQSLKNLATDAVAPAQATLVEVPKGPCAWECFIHGTQTKCPFKWVNCDVEEYRPDLDESGI